MNLHACLAHKCELVSLMTRASFETYVNVIQFEKRISHVNHATYPRFSNFEAKNPEDRSLAIFFLNFGISWNIIVSDTPQEENLTPLSQEKFTGIQ